MSPNIEALGSIPHAVVGAALLLAAAIGAGKLLIKLPIAGRGRFFDAVLIRTAIGLNLIGVVGVALGQLKLLADGYSPWLLAAFSLLNLPEVWRSWNQGTPKSAKPGRHRVRLRRLPRAVWLALALALITLGPALCYPTGWDELVYHSVLPKRWLADGWPAFYHDLPYSGFPSLGEILFWLVAPIENVIAPRLVNWIFWFIGLLLTYRLLRRSLNGASSVLLTTVFALAPAVLFISANCYVETLLMLNVTAMLAAVRRKRTGRRTGLHSDPPWVGAAVLGVLAGGAAAVKLTGLSALAIPLVWYVGQALQHPGRLWTAARSLVTFLALALLVSAPFYLRPYLATGNPFYPYFAEWFTDDPARIEMSRYHHALGGSAFGVKSVAAFITGPLLLAFRAENYDGTFGWQIVGLVILAAVAVAAARRSRSAGIVLWPAAIWVWMYLFWFLTAQQARFAVPAMLVLTVLAGLGLHRLRGWWRAAVLALLMGAAVVSLPWRTRGYYAGSWFRVFGRLSWTHYVDELTDQQYLPLALALRDHRFETAKLMLLFEHRGFYLPRPYVIGTPFFQEEGFTPPEQYGSAEAVLGLLTREQITHVVLTRTLTGPDRAAPWSDRLEPLLQGINASMSQGKLREVWGSERHVILEVRQ